MAQLPPPRIRIGTRPSPLALVQAEMVHARLKAQFPTAELTIVPIQSEGDRQGSLPIAEIGGKGIFIKALEQALLADEIDIAVHSFKDITSAIPAELEVIGFFAPESSQDVLVANGKKLNELPAGARVGTGSVRRIAQLARVCPGLQCVPVRGNVGSRVNLVKEGAVDAVILSEAGLIRLGLTDYIDEVLTTPDFVPAPGQGVIAIEVRRDDRAVIAAVSDISDHQQGEISRLELQMMSILGFDCQIPLGIASRAHLSGVEMDLFLSDRSGGLVWREKRVLAAEDTNAAATWAAELKQWGLAHGIR